MPKNLNELNVLLNIRVNCLCPFYYNPITDELGNQILHFRIGRLAPYGLSTIIVQANVRLSNTPHPETDVDRQRFLQAEPFIEIDDPAIRRTAAMLKETTTHQSFDRIFKWVAGHVQYSGYLTREQGSSYALRSKQGDCTEIMYLFAALGLANEIPVRCMGGYIQLKNGLIGGCDYYY